MFFGKLIALAAGAASLVASTSARPVTDNDVSYANATLEARTLPYGWSTARCKKVSGSLGFGCWKINYNLGCVCYEDIDAYCDKMNYPPIVTNYLKGHFALDMPTAKNYPPGSQPTCDSNTYTCTTGTFDTKTQSCPKTCGSNQCAQADGTCCPRGMKSFNGVCCSTTCSGASNGKCLGERACDNGQVLSNNMCCSAGFTGYSTVCCPAGQKEDSANPGKCICNDSSMQPGSDGKTCVSKCASKPGTKWCTTQCCRSDMSEVSGKCQCAAGYRDNGSACVPKCTNQQTYVAATDSCSNRCATGFNWSWKQGSTSEGLCCTTGYSCKQTRCCPSDQIESNGQCCPQGSVWNSNTKSCMAPSTGVKTRKRSLTGQVSLADAEALNLDIKLCPSGLSACPIKGAAQGQYECIDSQNDIQSCGGCASLGKGVDCTAIPGVRFTGCSAGECEVYSCLKGYRMVKGLAGNTCVRR